AISFGCETYAVSLPDIEDYIGHKITVATYDPKLLPELNRFTTQRRDKRPGERTGSRRPDSRRSGSRSGSRKSPRGA
ncbi:MAG TPA: hypothetical protein VFY27_13115, partial [Woeseiaceae bacterium]|nr:hypothetical protein [Woeseiaceae bacterium]